MQGLEVVAAMETERLSAIRAGVRNRLKNHWLALLMVLLGVGIGQVGVLIQKPFVNAANDSFGYLAVAHAILTSHNFFDPMRTPGYPIFLAAIFAIFGSQHLGIITAFQAALMTLTALELYALVYNMSGRRWLACVTAISLAATSTCSTGSGSSASRHSLTGRW